ncbi:MAG TPA: FAD-dependent thymidylate synthase [Limnochordia bacterium]|nr:FAD-dependent thymidylate synthase [Limnochordia bacterium]
MQVLNRGFINLVESMGGDAAAIRNARRCWRSEGKTENADRQLLRHLLKAGHKTPFEAMVFTFDVKTPLFVARQWFRHRIGSYNEESLRYCVALREYFVPEHLEGDLLEAWTRQNEASFDFYEKLVSGTGAAKMVKEQARSILPIGIYTSFYWTVNGSALMNFLNLRLDKHAQYEIRQYAEATLELVKEVAPISFGEFEREVLKIGG